MEAVRSYQTWSPRKSLHTCAMEQCIIGNSGATLRVVENYNIHSKTCDTSSGPDYLPLFLKLESCEKT